MLLFAEKRIDRQKKLIAVQYVHKPTRCTKFLWLDFIFYETLCMFRTILVHLQEQLYKLYIALDISRYHKSGCCAAIATQQPDVPAYTGIYQIRCTAYKVAPDDGLIQSETCRASHRKWSLITRILCILLFRIHIVGWCTVHKTSNK